jgi:hypothetical protein
MSLHELVWNISSEYLHGSLYGLIADSHRTNERFDDIIVLLVDIIIIYHNVVIDIIGSKYDIKVVIDKLKELNAMQNIIKMNSCDKNSTDSIYVKIENGIYKVF